MNVGFYLTTNDQYTDSMFNEIANALSSGLIKDAAIFVDNIFFTSSRKSCAIYESCDLWSFSGKLIVSEIRLLEKAKNIVNDIDLYYYFGFEKINPIRMLIEKDLKVIANGEKLGKEYFRLTNKKPTAISNGYENIVSKIL